MSSNIEQKSFRPLITRKIVNYAKMDISVDLNDESMDDFTFKIEKELRKLERNLGHKL